MLLLPPMHMLSHLLRSGSLFPLSWLPPLPRCPHPPCSLHSPSSLLVWLPHSVWLCCSSPCPLARLGAPCAHPHSCPTCLPQISKKNFQKIKNF